MVGPVRTPSLSSAPEGVKRRPAPRAAERRRQARLIEPIKKTRIAEEIANRIRRLILEGTLQSGEPLPSERDLAERFGVSRGSVRDALRMLETIGLLETRHGQGTFPRELDVGRLVAPLASVLTYRRDLQTELMDVRRMFEPAVARAAARRIRPGDLADLRRILETQRRKLRTGQSAILEDTAFHAVIARATQNRVIVSIMETLNDLLVESRKLTLKTRGRPERSIKGHEAVIDALAAGNGEAAADAMRRHIDQIAGLVQQSTKYKGQSTK